MKNLILAASAATLIPACRIGRPEPAYGEGDAPPGQPPAEADKAFPDIGKVDGDVPPDFDGFERSLAEKAGDTPPPPNEPPAQDKPPEAKPDATKPPPTDAPKTPALAKPDALAIPPRKPEDAPPATPPAQPPGEFNPDEALKKIEDIQIRENASPKTKEGFQNLKAITRTAIGKNKELTALVEELKKAPKSDPAVENELKDLREFKATFEAQNDPKVETEYRARLTGAEENILKTLTTDPELGMDQKEADDLKAKGFDTPEGRAHITDILARVDSKKDYILSERVREMFRGRLKITADHQAKLEEIKGKAGQYWETRQKAEETERQTWGQTADQSLIKLFQQPGYEWGHYKTIDDKMDPAAKAAAEKWNQNLKDVIVPRIREGIQAVWGRDPEKAMEYIAKAHATDHMREQLTAAQSELAKANERIKELEATAAGVLRISDPTRQESAPGSNGAPPTREAPANQTADDAVDDYMAQKYGKR